MNLHLARVRRGSVVYLYGQLVESYRRDDGMPTQRVVANLGQLTEVEASNLRTALAASRRGQQVFLDRRQLPKAVRFTKPTQNLRYLDLAVLVALWRDWGLDTVLRQILPPSSAEADACDVVAALTLQRVADPGSKLYAERWFPRTALPVLLGLDPKRFNNTRLHRVLDQLDAATPALMQRLPQLYRQRHGEFAALFLDVSDARFVGHGPLLAEKAKTKEGMVERKIGIVLLCNQHGYPLRWQVIAGKRPDAAAMHDVFEQIRGLEWLGQSPVVCDRSMGCSAEIARLLRTQVRFVTALRVNEFGAYTDAIPYQCLADLEPAPQEPADGPDPCIAEAARRVAKAGMLGVTPTLFVADLSVIERDAVAESAPRAPRASDEAARAMGLARQMCTMVDQGLADSLNSAARRVGLGIGAAKAYRQLLKLDVGIQQAVLEGQAAGVSLARLFKLARLADAERQCREFEHLRSNVPPVPPARGSAAVQLPDEAHQEIVLRVRGAVSFNPELFVDKRRTAQRQLQEVQSYVRELNAQLARPRSRRVPRDIERDIDYMLRRRNLVELYRIHVDPSQTVDGKRYQARVELDVEQWRCRRRYDGFSLIVAHPEVPHSAAELCQLYRAKDAVEKDFRTIKSLVRLRPIYHHTDAKVRAHVTLCMLALLLERTLDARLKRASAQAAVETLSTCCLNRFEDSKATSHYVVTQPDVEQQALLRELRLKQLADDDYVTERLRHN